MQLAQGRFSVGLLLCAVSLASTFGCAGPRLGSRLFPAETAEAAVDSAEAPHYVSGRMPLPSQQAVRPASVGLPAEGQFDQQAIQDIRTRRGGLFGGSAPRSNCFS